MDTKRRVHLRTQAGADLEMDIARSVMEMENLVPERTQAGADLEMDIARPVMEIERLVPGKAQAVADLEMEKSRSVPLWTQARSDLKMETDTSGFNNTEDLYREDRYKASDFGRSNSMGAAIYRAAIAGNIDGLRTVLQQDSELNLLNQLTPRDDTILHIAARLGHHHLAEHIQSCCPNLFKSKNYNNDHPLHLAAAGGHLSIVESLITNASQFARSRGPETEAVLLQEYFNVINGKNKQGNTPLHMAVKANQYKVALFLVERAGSVLSSCIPNLEKKSPLYLAAEAGHQELFERMIQFVVSKADNQNMLMDGQPLLHVAITTRNKVVLETASKNVSSLMDAPDRRGRKPLSYAASIGYVDGVCYILDTFADCTYKRDHDGSYPIHEASSQGHIEVVKEFLQRFPDSRELLNKQGQNILHVAAKYGKANIVSYILKAPELKMLINDTDEDGNTPLLLATKNAHAEIVSILTWDKRVRLEIENGEGFTALDAALDYEGTSPSIHERLTWIALRHASAPRARQLKTSKTKKNSNVEAYKDRINTLLLVATIIITVTFAAGITVPGGYDDSKTHKGMALMVKKSAFQVFVMANAIAMYSSIIVAVLLVWAQLGDLNLIRVSLKLASPLFGGALMMVAISFMTGEQITETEVAAAAEAGKQRRSDYPWPVDRRRFGIVRDVGNGTDGKESATSRLNDHINFSSWPASCSRFMPEINENGNESIEATSQMNGHLGNSNSGNRFFVPSFENESWNDSGFTGLKRSRDGDEVKFSGFNALESHQNGEYRHYTTTGLTHHVSLPKTSAETAAIDKFLQFQQDSVPCKIWAKRGYATHPRSIAEDKILRLLFFKKAINFSRCSLCSFWAGLVRRTKISGRMRKLQELFPNMDKETNTADMLDLAVEYIKDLQEQLKILTNKQAKCR
ncbi:unnamed protein product [Camellia sinensis]